MKHGQSTPAQGSISVRSAEQASPEIATTLLNVHTIAVVGASNKPWRDSNAVARYLLRAGYRVVPVNPNYTEVLDLPCFPSLRDVPIPIDIVDVFRNPNEIVPIVRDAIAVRARVLWLQLGVINAEAIRIAQDAGLTVVEDRCIAVEHRLVARGV